MLKARYSSLDEIPELHRPLYRQRSTDEGDEVWEIELEGAEEVFAAPLSKALVRLKRERAQLKSTLDKHQATLALLEEEDLSPEDISHLLEIREKGDLPDRGTGPAPDEETQRQLQKAEKELATARTQADAFRGRYLQAVKANAAERALERFGVGDAKRLLLGPVLERIDVTLNDRGEASAALKLLDGDEEEFDFPESVDDFVRQMKDHPLYRRVWPNTEETAANGDSPDKSTKSPTDPAARGKDLVRISRDDAKDPVRYRRAKAQAEERGVPLEISN